MEVRQDLVAGRHGEFHSKRRRLCRVARNDGHLRTFGEDRGRRAPVEGRGLRRRYGLRVKGGHETDEEARWDAEGAHRSSESRGGASNMELRAEARKRAVELGTLARTLGCRLTDRA